MDSMGRKQGEKVGLVGCHGMGGNQVCVQCYIDFERSKLALLSSFIRPVKTLVAKFQENYSETEFRSVLAEIDKWVYLFWY